MGNQVSQAKGSTLAKELNKIAMRYITTQNFKDLYNLENKNYCNKLVIMTSDIIDKYVSDRQVQYLIQRLKGDEIINEMTKEKILYFDKDNLRQLDTLNPIQKRRMCIGISRFYIKIGHLYAAIWKTLNPIYSFVDLYGYKKKYNLLEKYNLPKNIILGQPKYTNLCSRLHNALTPSIYTQTKNNKINQVGKVNLCSMNQNQKTGKTKILIDEVGIPELKELYKDVYDYNTGRFVRMSEKAKKEYLSDVVTFYKAFTGKKTVPSEIDSFKKIPLNDYHNKVVCKGNNAPFRRTFNIKSKMYEKYAKHLANMVKTTQNNQNKLIDILNQVFQVEVNKQTNKQIVTIRPDLTHPKLQTIIENARKLIISLYIQCEQDFDLGLKLLEAIIEQQLLQTYENKKLSLENQLDNILIK